MWGIDLVVGSSEYNFGVGFYGLQVRDSVIWDKGFGLDVGNRFRIGLYFKIFI